MLCTASTASAAINIHSCVDKFFCMQSIWVCDWVLLFDLTYKLILRHWMIQNIESHLLDVLYYIDGYCCTASVTPHLTFVTHHSLHCSMSHCCSLLLPAEAVDGFGCCCLQFAGASMALRHLYHNQLIMDTPGQTTVTYTSAGQWWWHSNGKTCTYICNAKRI